MRRLRVVFVLMLALALVGCGENGESENAVQEEAGKPERVEYDVVFEFAEYTVDSIRSTIDGDEVKITFDWTNQSGKETPFTALGYFDVLQGEEILKEISGAYSPGGNSLLQRRTANGVTVPGEATFKIVSNDPIVVSFGATLEYDDNNYDLIIE